MWLHGPSMTRSTLGCADCEWGSCSWCHQHHACIGAHQEQQPTVKNGIAIQLQACCNPQQQQLVLTYSYAYDQVMYICDCLVVLVLSTLALLLSAAVLALHLCFTALDHHEPCACLTTGAKSHGTDALAYPEDKHIYVFYMYQLSYMSRCLH